MQSAADAGAAPCRSMEALDVDHILGQLLEVRHTRPSKLVQLTEQEISALCFLSREVFMEQPILLELGVPLKICGDVHGQYSDLLKLFECGGFPPEANYLFLGDYVDRGKQSLETICCLLAYKAVTSNKGVHVKNQFLIQTTLAPVFVIQRGWYDVGVKALPLSATSCVVEVYEDAQAAFSVVDIATNYDFSNLSSLEVDERNAQQFVEQLGPGKRPLWAVPVILRPEVFACVFRESGSMRSHMAKSSALKELKHWTLRNSQQLKVTFFSDGDAGAAGQRMVVGGPEVALQQMPSVVGKERMAVKGEGVPLEAAAERALRELLRAEEKEKAQRAKREEKSGKARPVVFPSAAAMEVATSPGSETEASEEESGSSEVAVAVCDANRASILQLLTGWLGSVRAEESCHKARRREVVNANYWHYRRNENA
eukprot:s647_g25.t2